MLKNCQSAVKSRFSLTLILKKIKIHWLRVVELRGVEPLSENNLTRLSPGGVNYLHSLAAAGIDTLYGLVASLFMVRAKLTARTDAT